MKTAVSESSVIALYEHLLPAGHFASQSERVIDWLRGNPGWRSRREISAGTGIEPGAVAGRVNSLLAAGRLIESNRLAQCRVTGRSVKRVRLPVAERQVEMFGVGK